VTINFSLESQSPTAFFDFAKTALTQMPRGHPDLFVNIVMVVTTKGGKMCKYFIETCCLLRVLQWELIENTMIM